MLRCPKCRELMKAEEVTSHYGSPLELFHCHSCSGIWVDRDVAFAVSRDSALEVEPDVELDEIVTEPRAVAFLCPRCEVFLSEQTGMNLPEKLHIDYCTTCHGFWFDKGELMIYKTFLEEKRAKSKTRLIEEEEKRRRQERLKEVRDRASTSWRQPMGIGYHPGLELARQLLRMYRLLQ